MQTWRIVIVAGPSSASWDTEGALDVVIGWAGYMIQWTMCSAYIYEMGGEETPCVASLHTSESDMSQVRIHLGGDRAECWNQDCPKPQPGDLRMVR